MARARDYKAAREYTRSIRACYRCFGLVEAGRLYDVNTMEQAPTITCLNPECRWAIVVRPGENGRLYHDILHDPRAGGGGEEAS